MGKMRGGAASWKARRARKKVANHHGPLCHFMGCGEVAVRTAWDRLCNVVRACDNPDHGRDIGS